MTTIAVRLSILLLLALSLRAATGQSPVSPGQRGDPYALAVPPAPSDPNRYPLTVQQPVFRFQQPAPQPSPPFQPAAPLSGAMRPASQPPEPQQPAPPIADSQRYPGAAQPEFAQRPTYGTPLPSGPLAAPAAAPLAPPPAPGELFQAGQIVAIVGDQFILYGDVAQTVNQMLEPALAKAAPAERSAIEAYRPQLTRRVVKEMADSKLLYLAFLRNVEEEAGRDKMAEVKQNINKKIRESFAKELEHYRKEVETANKAEIEKLLRREPTVVRLALMMKENRAESISELSGLLQRYGSTLDEQIRQYGEHTLGKQMVFKSINTKPEVTHQEMLDYYAEHAADYAVPAKAKFEILTVKFANFPSKADAYNAIAAMGNEVYFGAPFNAVARKSSQEPNAEKGGFYDWTNQGSLASGPIDQALFTLEPGKLSQVIEDERGFHIVRVIERSEAGSVSFLEAQKAIKEDIIARKRDADYKKFLASLSKSTKVWTIYDDQDATARQPSGALQR